MTGVLFIVLTIFIGAVLELPFALYKTLFEYRDNEQVGGTDQSGNCQQRRENNADDESEPGL